MKINRQDYDRLPFAIRLGALHLWGTQLSSYSRFGQFCRLYSFNDFFAEIGYDKHKPVCVCTFSSIEGLKPYLDKVSWQNLLN